MPLRAHARVDRRFAVALGALVAARLAVPLIALAAHGHKVPALQRWDYTAQTGDAQGFYAAARAFISAWGALPRAVVAVVALLLAGGLVAAVRAWRRHPSRRPWVLAGGALGLGLAVCVAITKMHAAGAAVFGWSLLWSLPMLPARAVGHLTPDVAFGLGLALSLIANAVGIVATVVAGARATGRRSLGLVAGLLVAAWPLLAEPIAGHGAWQNGQWLVDTGLHLYTEPVATALVAVAFALLLAERLRPLTLSAAGVLLSYATLVKVSNGVLLAVALVLVAHRIGVRRTVPFLAGGLSFMPVVAAYWHLGYVPIFDNPQSWPTRPFSVQNVVPGWRDSLLFHPHTLLVIVPLAAIGVWALRRRGTELALLGAWVGVNPVFYSFYRNLPEHPRFLYGSLPALWILSAAGAAWLVAGVVRVASGSRPRWSAGA